MEDKEIYRTGEEWPLSTDERVTLKRETESLYERPLEDTEEEKRRKRQEKEKERRKKRLLTKGMALFVSAVVATGVLTGGGGIIKRTTEDSETTAYYVCPICQTVGCEFWQQSAETQRSGIVGGDSIDVTGDQHYGITTIANDSRSVNTIAAILMPDGRRAALIPGKSEHYDYWKHLGNVTNIPERAVFPQNSVSSQSYSSYIQVSPMGEHFHGWTYGTVLQLIYVPDGKEPDIWEYTDDWKSHHGMKKTMKEFKYAVSKPVKGEPCLWIRSYSNFSQDAAEDLLKTSDVEIWDAGNIFALGKTLEFTETDRIRLTGETHTTNGNQAGDYYISWKVRGYEYWLAEISEDADVTEFCSFYAQNSTFEDICKYTAEKQKLAQDRGHEFTQRIKRLEQDHVLLNGVGYSIYLYGASNRKEKNVTRLRLFISPDAEPNIALSVDVANIFSEDLQVDDLDNIRSLTESDLYRESDCASTEEFLDHIKSSVGISVLDILKCISRR